ncbi:SDR family NAD(P)-dependent oxidoreductase [Kitasatospora brasiliensis]|uniref:SDR family NAD(P)-dependent oxidoreductase n=1 Tax=Kitasatospora brasiliensis TaxID=3058040 RepID=UPI00292F46EF|nr:SDR family NAD(P)-dependent oxidoreductase [Kitasatospora sp. K002]
MSTPRPESAGPNALVTGATSSVGLAVAMALGKAGHRVFICGRNSDTIGAALDELRVHNITADGIPADVRSPEQVTRLVQAAANRYGPIRVLVNNAGRCDDTVAVMDDDLLLDVIDSNLHSVLRVSREVLTAGGMVGAGHGRIINITSTGRRQGALGRAPFTVSGTGVMSFTRSLGQEMAASGITVNAVCPGHHQDSMAQRIDQTYARVWGAPAGPAEALPTRGRRPAPEEVAGLVGYLASAAAASITAQTIHLCGGVDTDCTRLPRSI